MGLKRQKLPSVWKKVLVLLLSVGFFCLFCSKTECLLTRNWLTTDYKEISVSCFREGFFFFSLSAQTKQVLFSKLKKNGKKIKCVIPTSLILSLRNRQSLFPSHTHSQPKQTSFLLIAIELLLVQIYAKEQFIEVWESHQDTVQHDCFSLHLKNFMNLSSVLGKE